MLDLKNDLEYVKNAYDQSGKGCLPSTRMKLLSGIDKWARDPLSETTAWVHGYAGSGKSALLKSVAKNLQKAYMPFTVFMCTR